MVLIILGVYILVALVGIGAIVVTGDELKAQIIIGLFSYTGVCGATTITVYTIKASKENQIKISNDIYRMKLSLAKEIYKDVSANKLDDKSIALLNLLNDDTKSEDTLTSVLSVPQIEVPIKSEKDDGLG